jgi:hypothetical protein
MAFVVLELLDLDWVLSESTGTPISNIGVCGTHVGVVGRNLANCKNSKQELFFIVIIIP